MDFVTKLPISMNWKSENYDFILVIVDLPTKMVYYKPVKIIIDTSRLAKIIFNVIIWHPNLLDSILTNRNLLFISKF